MRKLKNTEESPITNAIGAMILLIAAAGLATKWWAPGHFHGDFTEITFVAITGAVFIFGLADDFLRKEMEERYEDKGVEKRKSDT